MTTEYQAWSNIIRRCTDPNSQQFKNYGGRGIAVCAKWRHSFPAFLADVGRKPKKDLMLERIDNDKGYEPGNVRWATAKQQARNRRSNRHLVCYGLRLTVAEWAERQGVNSGLIHDRLDRGWTVKEAIYKKPRRIENA